MPKEKVNQRISRRKNSSNITNSKTATSEADKIAARLAAARSIKSSTQRKRQDANVELVASSSQSRGVRNFEDSCNLSQIQEQEMRDEDREEALAALADASSNMNTLRSMENAPTDTTKTFYSHMIEGLKRSLGQNKHIYEAIYEMKASQDAFQKETNEKLNIISEKINQLITPEDSYWKSLASKTCKTQLPILGLYPDDSEFKKGFESILEQEKPGYIEQLGLQWNHFYLERVRPLCRDVIKSRRCDKAKDVRSAMFDIFGENLLTRINTSAGAGDIATFKNSNNTKNAFKCLFISDDDGTLPYIEAIKKKAWERKKTTLMDTAFTLAVCEIVLNLRHPRISVSDNALHKRFDLYLVYCIHNFKEITSEITKQVRQDELGKTCDNSDDTSESDDHRYDDRDEDQENDQVDKELGENYNIDQDQTIDE
ncbi:uncharacterized protein OCT59_028242 [Rhizophagus irregularis]|uniref:uncharacterized protein n=1 Tax=Rhizophagus irregularis TaxID=588596 RepID=UPI000CBA7144|nr:hypothetical protein OCT59_028242 [Rhizophagus irregularis]GBC43434.1 hypothetical protein GLOIN_2v1763777 [Rhizophagus irregularis DAOM 181602=DAOM 197198]